MIRKDTDFIVILQCNVRSLTSAIAEAAASGKAGRLSIEASGDVQLYAFVIENLSSFEDMAMCSFPWIPYTVLTLRHVLALTR